MVISIETTMNHPKRGFVKLEDTVLVTADGWEAFGDGAAAGTRPENDTPTSSARHAGRCHHLNSIGAGGRR